MFNTNQVSFTGSVPTGKKIMEVASRDVKRVTLEMGGNDAAIVMGDVDIAKTAPAVFNGAFYNTGQVSTLGERRGRNLSEKEGEDLF